MSDPTDADWYPQQDEDRRDALRDDDNDPIWDNACPHTTTAGEHCARTIHLTGLHTWEQK